MLRRSQRTRTKGGGGTVSENLISLDTRDKEPSTRKSTTQSSSKRRGQSTRRGFTRQEDIRSDEELVGPSASTDGATTGPIEFSTPVYAKKSEPTLPLGPANKLKWLCYPHSLINKVKTEEELDNLTYISGARVESSEEIEVTASEYVQIDDEDDNEWETLSDSEEPTGEWEEQLVYVELNDIPSIQELFAVQPDDFLRFQRKRHRMKAQPVKATHPKISIQFHQFQSASPVLQIGNRYFACHWEEPTGTAMFFRKKADEPIVIKQEAGVTSSKLNNKDDPSRRPCSTLKNIIPEPSIPRDNIFGKAHLITRATYETVSLADKTCNLQTQDTSRIYCY
ncbi:uncharacterized protein LOC110842859 isoform X2 [Folsomia candida]|uniref:uncharacterized protein LOC110842859 isoform X2 n=1 Tax=Folsomia candida TaxID=158441 RepID=UPI001604F40E|nr:uncharacterized protein LOC110842859 isoform X2 [Folsomia candida]